MYKTALELLTAGAFPKTVIAFGGPLRSGKSLASKYLIERHGFVNHPIAIGVKDMCRVLGLTNEHLYGSLKEAPTALICDNTPRHALQTLAQWGRENISPTIWVEYWARTIPPGLNRVVIDDLRTVEGSIWMHSQGAKLVKVVRPGIENELAEARKHVTETQFDSIKFDYTVRNDGTIEEFKRKLDELLKTLEDM